MKTRVERVSHAGRSLPKSFSECLTISRRRLAAAKARSQPRPPVPSKADRIDAVQDYHGGHFPSLRILSRRLLAPR
jgi:hypothetical protein